MWWRRWCRASTTSCGAVSNGLLDRDFKLQLLIKMLKQIQAYIFKRKICDESNIIPNADKGPATKNYYQQLVANILNFASRSGTWEGGQNQMLQNTHKWNMKKGAVASVVVVVVVVFHCL